MSSKSTTAFFNHLQAFQQDLTVRVKELKDAAYREDVVVSKRPSRLAWLDEVDAVQETLSTQTELARSAIRLHSLVAFAESCADAMEAALTRAENLAAVRYNYEVPSMAATPRPTRSKSLDSPVLVEPASLRHEQPLTPGRLSHAKARAARTTRPQTPLTDKTNVTPLWKSIGGKSPQRKTPVANIVEGTLARRRYANVSPALSDPPTPKMEDLGLSAAAMNLLKRMQ